MISGSTVNLMFFSIPFCCLSELLENAALSVTRWTKSRQVLHYLITFAQCHQLQAPMQDMALAGTAPEWSVSGFSGSCF